METITRLPMAMSILRYCNENYFQIAPFSSIAELWDAIKFSTNNGRCRGQQCEVNYTHLEYLASFCAASVKVDRNEQANEIL